MGLWICSTLGMTIAGRELSRELQVLEIIALRNFMGAILLLPLVLWTGGKVFRTANPLLHAVRNLSHFCAQYLWFAAVALVPLAQVVAIEFTMPIWTAVLAALLLGERITPRRAMAITLGFAGVLLIVRPGFATHNAGTLAALGSAVGFSLSVTLVKRLTAEDRVLTIVVHMFATQAIISALLVTGFSLAAPGLFEWVWPSPELLPFVALLALAGTAGHFFLTRATATLDAMLVAPMDFLRVPLTALMGFALYSEPLTAAIAVGAALILLGNLLNRRRGTAA
jgi:drug/metabolite transporter (DMT)-like permease